MLKNEHEQLVKVISFWKDSLDKADLFDREIVNDIDVRSKEVIDLTGVRRSGKSSILKLLIKKLALSDNFIFINFEDPYFIEHNNPSVIEEIVEIYKEYFSHNLKYLFFDEIHVVKDWEKAVRKLRDSEKYKIFITGSSSKLLSREMSSLLTGRHLSYHIFPLSFREFLEFKKIRINTKKDVILNEKMLLKEFSEYLSIGGFPEIVITKNRPLLKQYFFDIVQKDILARYNIREMDILEKLGVNLITNSAKTFSIDAIRKTFNISFESASNYIGYFKDSFLIFELPQFSYSLKTQQKAPKKVYSVDTGLANVVAFRFSEDKGRMLEQCVFLHLKRKYGEVYYYKTKVNGEVDFLVKNNPKDKNIIQTTWSLEDKDTRKREIGNLLVAMKELSLKKGLILTYNWEEIINQGDKVIIAKPFYKYIFEDELN